MNKELILNYLKEHENKKFTGMELLFELKITRSNLYKAIAELRRDDEINHEWIENKKHFKKSHWLYWNKENEKENNSKNP